ncbi:hypothetical protein CEY04_08925 [Achromobacter sp. HZ28]|nr:hypothetical protein CEY05_19005 [Achromobacter sp. HZ34]OWT79775.1 hypothetical protein CEY04_08925 [Achromobacter sp. HZ28]
MDVCHDDLAEIFAAEIDLGWDPTDFDERLHTFSDCIVISVRPQAEEIGLLIFMVFRICRQLLEDGFLSRGGVAKGLLYHRVNPRRHPAGEARGTRGHSPPVTMVFGPAFVEAYNFESVHADGSRVILQTKVWREIDHYCTSHPDRKLAQFFRAHIRRADDGPAYVDLFADFVCSGSFYSAKRNLDDEIRTIKKHVCDALDVTADKPRYFRKSALLARMFNRAVTESRRDEHLIPGSILPSSHPAP